jgi:hypothetical protein
MMSCYHNVFLPRNVPKLLKNVYNADQMGGMHFGDDFECIGLYKWLRSCGVEHLKNTKDAIRLTLPIRKRMIQSIKNSERITQGAMAGRILHEDEFFPCALNEEYVEQLINVLKQPADYLVECYCWDSPHYKGRKNKK